MNTSNSLTSSRKNRILIEMLRCIQKYMHRSTSYMYNFEANTYIFHFQLNTIALTDE